jgi:hypothetical protein
MFGYTGPWESRDVIVIVLIGVPLASSAGRLFAVDAASPVGSGGASAPVSAAPVLAGAVLAAVSPPPSSSESPHAANPTTNAQQASTATRTRDHLRVA